MIGFSLQVSYGVARAVFFPLPGLAGSRNPLPMKKAWFVFALFLLLVGCSTGGRIVPPIQIAPAVSPLPGGGSVTNTVSIVAPEWIETLRGVQQLPSIVPFPGSQWVGFGASGLLAVLSLIARSRQRKAEEVAASIIHGVEAMGVSAEPVKQSVERASIVRGNSAEVHNAVQKNL